MKILIIESNPPNMVAQGLGNSQPFFDTFATIAPGVETAIAEPYDTALDTDDLAGFDGVIFSGSGVEWNTSDDRAAPLAEAMRTTFAAGLPVWGSCNGMQLAASVLGGTVGESPNGFEGGLANDLALTEAGKAHPMMAGRRDGWAVPCVHRDEVTALPQSAMLLAGNAHSGVQAFAVAKDGVDFWGSQYHPEFSAGLVGDMLRAPRHGNRYTDLAADLEAAETNASAAARIGTTPAEQSVAIRALELGNWLTHIRARQCSAGESLKDRYPGAERFRFGDNRQLCEDLLALVRAGKKTATCGALRDFSSGREALPDMGRFDIATNWDGVPALVIRSREITLCKFKEVTEDFALAEGENTSLEGWRTDHRAYFERNGGWDPEMMLVCERFELIEDLG